MNSFHNLIFVFSLFFIGAVTAQSPEVSRKPLAEKITQLEKVYPQTETISPFSPAEYDEHINELIVREVSYFHVDYTLIDNILQNHFAYLEISIPWNDTSIILQLFPSEIFSSTFQVVTSQTNKKAIDYVSGSFYRGIVKDNPESLVAINFFKDNISGIVSIPGIGNITIAQLKSSPIHVIFNDADLLIPNELNCSTPEPENFNYKKKENADAKLLISPCVKVYIEADFEMFEAQGGATETADYIVGMFNISSTLFYNEGITDVISEIFVWVTVDPYPVTSSFDALDYFTTFRTDFNGDLAHLVTFDDENLGGVAWVDVLCSSYNYAYSNIDAYYADFPTYSWTVMVFTHEMGHNLGSSHTHNCDWPGGAIDNCYTTEGGCDPGPAPIDGGTIMSYCHLTGYGINFANGFGELPGDLIFDEVNAAPCLGDCDLPPTNDWPCSATVLEVNESCIFFEGTNVGAINSVVTPETCDGISNGDIWFQFTVPAEEYVIIEMDNGAIINDMGMRVYYGSCTDLSNYPGACVADGSSYADLMPGFEVVLAPAGTIIFLRVWEVNNDAFGDFSICVYTECNESTEPEGLIATDTVLCAEGTVTLTIDGGALGSISNWIWTIEDCEVTPIGFEDNLTVSPEITTTYYLQADGACGTTDCVSLTIEVESVPETPVIIVGDCQLSTYILTDATYIWYLDGEIIIGETDNFISIAESGNYSVLITSEGGCFALSNVVFVDCEQLGIDAIISAEIKIYPNPGDGAFNIEINGYTGELMLQIFDIFGREVWKQNIFISTQNNTVSTQSALASGVYFLQVRNAEVDAAAVLIIE